MGKSFLASRKLLRDRELGREHRGGERRRLFLSTQWPKNPAWREGGREGKGQTPVVWLCHGGGDTRVGTPRSGIQCRAFGAARSGEETTHGAAVNEEYFQSV